MTLWVGVGAFQLARGGKHLRRWPESRNFLQSGAAEPCSGLARVANLDKLGRRVFITINGPPSRSAMTARRGRIHIYPD